MSATLSIAFVGSPSATEGGPGTAGSVTVRVTAVGIFVAGETAGATLGAVAGSATVGTDFFFDPIDVSFTTDGFQDFVIPFNPDLIDEFDETFSIRLTAPTNTIGTETTTIGANSILATILDDDVTPPNPPLISAVGTLGFGNTVVITVDESVGSVTIPVLFSGASASGATQISFTYSTSNGTNTNAALVGSDYLAVSGSQFFPPVAEPLSFPLTIPIIDDTDAEITESFVLGLDSINGAAPGGTQRVIINILDNDSGQGATVPPGSNPTFGPEAPFFPVFVDGNNQVVGAGGNDTLFGGKGNDSLTGLGGNDTVYGGQDQDLLFGNSGNDFLFGNKGDDNLYGGQGDDILYGGQGNDTIYGNDGNDFLAGDLGVDVLAGAQGADQFAIQAGKGTDYAADFTVGEDFLALTGGLQFGSISILQSGNDTVLRLNESGEDLMVLVNVQSFLVTATSFITV